VKTPGIIEYGRWPAARDGTRRRADDLARQLWEAIPNCALVTLQVQRPVDDWDDLVAWACLNLKGTRVGKVPERRLPGALALSAPEGIEELERQLLELLVGDLLGAHVRPAPQPLVQEVEEETALDPDPEEAPAPPERTATVPRLRVLPGAASEPPAPPEDEEEPELADGDPDEESERRGPFLRVLPGGLDPRA